MISGDDSCRVIEKPNSHSFARRVSRFDALVVDPPYSRKEIRPSWTTIVTSTLSAHRSSLRKHWQVSHLALIVARIIAADRLTTLYAPVETTEGVHRNGKSHRIPRNEIIFLTDWSWHIDCHVHFAAISQRWTFLQEPSVFVDSSFVHFYLRVKNNRSLCTRPNIAFNWPSTRLPAHQFQFSLVDHHAPTISTRQTTNRDRGSCTRHPSSPRSIADYGTLRSPLLSQPLTTITWPGNFTGAAESNNFLLRSALRLPAIL